MSSRTTHQTPAIVLKAINYGEFDRIVTFFTRDHGKLTGIAKGAKNSRRRFANTLDPFSCSQLFFSQRKPEGLAFLEKCDMEEHFGAIRSHLEKTVFASYLVELVDAFTPDRKRHEDLFELLRNFLDLMNGTETPESLARFFEIRLLKLAGYDPVLDRCVACHQPLLSPDGYHFHPAAGGIQCGRCSPGNGSPFLISTGTIRTLLLAKDMPIDKLARLVLSRQSAMESRRLLSRFITHLLGKELKSVRVLEQIQGLG